MFQQILKYLRFFFKAETVYSVHSPFVFDFLQRFIEDKRHYYAFDKIEALRQRLLQTSDEIKITDLGAGHQGKKLDRRKIKDIANSAVSSPKQGQLLFKMVEHFKPKTIIELGTSLGITSLYLAEAHSKTKLFTLEGSEQIAKVAGDHFKKMKLENIEQILGNFDHTYLPLLKKNNQADFVFIDGNHRKEPTIRYFKQALNYTNSDSILIFDDIYWSDEMQEAWEEIKAHEKVTLSIDLFYMGIVFFKEDHLEKRHYKLVEKWKKPWIMGFFSASGA